MTNPDPGGKGEAIRLIIEEYQIPTIINRASGGISINREHDVNLLYITDQIPYDWILPYIYAMIHHGGSGTTHMGLKYGCASMIIPHIIDQFVWDDIVVQAGAGPRGVSIQHFTMSKIETKVLELLSNDIYKARAEEITQRMEVENYSPTLMNYIVS
ncbi:MAG: hypothetical protein HKN87_15740 [Saprospiraceae bacterium]|nr:hypothetical protein [Saprospiraceae bacterium]